MKLISILTLAIFLSGSLFAQTDDEAAVKPLVIEDITKKMSKGIQPGFRIDVYDAKKKGAVDALTKAMKEENKAKLELVNNEYVVTGAVIKSISQKPLNVYCIVNEYEDKVELLFFFEQDSVFLTKEKNESEYIAARKQTRDFAVRAYKAAVQERMDAENKKLKELESQLDNLYKENDKLQKKVSEEKQKIDNIKEKISTSELDQERTRKQVQEQKAKVSQVKTGGSETLVKEEEKKLKSLESDLSRLQKQEDGFRKDITKGEADIRDYERSISNNEASAQLKQEEVTKQKEVINKLKRKYDSIK